MIALGHTIQYNPATVCYNCAPSGYGAQQMEKPAACNDWLGKRAIRNATDCAKRTAKPAF